MKRILVVAASGVVALGWTACGPPKLCDPDNLSTKAQLCPNREEISFGPATYVGTRPIEAVALRNGGVPDLVIASVATAGDSAFRYTASWVGVGDAGVVLPCGPKECGPNDNPDVCGFGRPCVHPTLGTPCTAVPCTCACAVVKGGRSVFVQVEFRPGAGKAYSGSLSVGSNAEKEPNKTIAVTGCGVPADGGASACFGGG